MAVALPIAPDADSVTSRRWSYDAWAMVQPRRAFAHVLRHLPPSGAWTALRRPLCLALGLGCGVSVLAAGLLTLRIAVSASLYWTFVPLAEIAGLVVATWAVRGISASQKIDGFFIGHGPVTLFLLGLFMTLALQPGDLWWDTLTGPAVVMWFIVLVWGAYVDFCCFRALMQMTRTRALATLLVQRAISWVLVFGLFAVPRPGLLIRELVESARELI